ncbi:MAG: hypothetical protein U5K74_14310 [Gemmatimonadaceae bacterium]|nr:hypothetical protein [Gemmatimonadaceae bacterium]
MPQLVTSILPVVNVGLAGMVLAAVTSRLVLPTIAAEGTMWWLLRAAPVQIRDIIFAKYWAATGPLALVAVGIVGLTSLLLGTAPIVMALSMLAVAALMFAQAALALYIGSVNPRFDAETAVNQTVTWQGILFLLSAGIPDDDRPVAACARRCTPVCTQRGDPPATRCCGASCAARCSGSRSVDA